MGEMPGPNRRWTVRLVVAALALALVAAFIAQNYVAVEVRVLFWSVDIRLAWAVLLAALGGIAIGWLFARASR